MEILRFSRDVYGQEVLQGISWDLLPAFFYGALAVIGVHLVISAIVSQMRKRQS